MGQTAGLGFIEGSVEKFTADRLKIPQTGWNQIQIRQDSSLFHGVTTNAYVYFNHSFYCKPIQPKNILAETNYGQNYASAVQKGNLYGVQFHPEKSQRIGIQILKNYVDRC